MGHTRRISIKRNEFYIIRERVQLVLAVHRKKNKLRYALDKRDEGTRLEANTSEVLHVTYDKMAPTSVLAVHEQINKSSKTRQTVGFFPLKKTTLAAHKYNHGAKEHTNEK